MADYVSRNGTRDSPIMREGGFGRSVGSRPLARKEGDAELL